MVDPDFHGEASIDIQAPPDSAYDLVADITRMGEWSPECRGGRWLEGASAATPGARFKGFNKGRFSWSTQSRIVTAERGRELTFVREKPALFGAVEWRYRFTALPDGGTRVDESFRQVKHEPAVAILLAGIVTGVKGDDRRRFNVDGMQHTLQRLKAFLETPSP